MKKNKRLIAKIFNGEEVVMKIDRNMLSCEFGALDRGNLTDVVNWGIYANRGSISFIDNIGYFNQQNINSSKFKNYIVKFYLAKNEETLISTFKVDTVDFDDETRRVDIQLIGKVIELQKQPSTQNGNKDVLSFYETTTKHLIGLDPPSEINEIYKYYESYPSYGLQQGVDLDNLKNTYIYCSYLPFGTLWDRMSKICETTMCRIFDDENGLPIISGERQSGTPIIVNPKNILSISKGEFVNLINPSIVLTDRQKYSSKKLEQLEKHLSIKYKNEDDLPSAEGQGIYVPGADYTIGDIQTDNGRQYILAQISFKVKSANKIFRVTLVKQLKETSSFNITNLTTTSSITEEEYIGDVKVVDNYGAIHLDSEFEIMSLDSAKINNVISFDFSFFVDYFEDGETETIKIINDSYEVDNSTIQSNDLIQTKSYYKDASGNKVPLGEHILNEAVRRYGNGRECFEIECLFNDYYDENGNKVFDNDDLSTHFKKYDVIVPYVKKKGKTVPLRVNEDGTPKKFRVIGISYSYDGFLKQKLSVQEERYDVD